MMIEDDFEDRFVNCIDKNFFFPHVCLRFNILTLFPPPLLTPLSAPSPAACGKDRNGDYIRHVCSPENRDSH